MNNKLILYKSIIRPIILYAAPIWSNTCKTNYNKLEAVQSKILRMISGKYPNVSNKIIRNKLKMPTLKQEIQKHSKNFYEKQIPKVESLKNIVINYENLAFKLRHKLPYHIHMQIQ